MVTAFIADAVQVLNMLWFTRQIQRLRRGRLHAIGQLKRQRMTELKGWCVIELRHLPGHGLDNLGAAMPQTRTPQARQAIEDAFYTG